MGRVVKSASFVQLVSKSRGLQLHRQSEATVRTDATVNGRAGKAVQGLLKDSERLKSTVLAQLALRIADSPFGKVKGLIQKLIERLLAESTAESSKKGYCDKELADARKDRDSRHMDVMRINAKASALEAKQDELADEIKTLNKELAKLTEALKSQGEEREDTKAENLSAIKDAQTGQDAVREAIRILKDFYLGENGAGGANSAKVKTSSAWKTDTSMRQYGQDVSLDYGRATPEAYNGQQDAFNSIHELMKVLLDDFSRSVTETRAQEAQEQADFLKYFKDTTASIASKKKKK